MTGSSQTRAAVRAVVSRPRLWPTALHQARVLAPRGWWRRRPFLPVPDRRWMAFRTTTAYGDPEAPIDAEDLVVWLDWSRRQRRLHRDRTPETPGAQTPGAQTPEAQTPEAQTPEARTRAHG